MKKEKTRHPLFRLWVNRRQMCNNPNNSQYHQYGARGIHFDPEWDSDFWAFADWMDHHLGPRPTPDHVLDRIDNDSGFYPGNLRWATRQQDSRNRRTNHHLTYRRRTLTYAEWSEITGLPLSTIWSRIVDRGWTAGEALGYKQHKKT